MKTTPYLRALRKSWNKYHIRDPNGSITLHIIWKYHRHHIAINIKISITNNNNNAIHEETLEFHHTL